MVNKDLVKQQSEVWIKPINELSNLDFKLTHYWVENIEHYYIDGDKINERYNEEFTFECEKGKHELRLTIRTPKSYKLKYELRWKQKDVITYSERCRESFGSGAELLLFIDKKFYNKK